MPDHSDLPAGFWRDEDGVHHDHGSGGDLDAKIARIERDIAAEGFALFPVVITAEDRADDPDAVDYTYTAGLRETFGHADLLVSGMSLRSAALTLATVVDRLREGERFADGDTSDWVLDGSPVLFVAIPDATRRGYLAMTDGWYAGEAFDALQVVFPDPQGRWPWEEGSRAVPQQMLGRPPGARP